MRFALRHRLFFLLLLFLASCSVCRALPQAAPGGSSGSGAPTVTVPANAGDQAAPRRYRLTPQEARKALVFAESERELYFLEFAYSLIVLLLLLLYRLPVRYRNWAEGLSRNRLAQSALFAPALLFTLAILNLPADIAGHSLSRRFGMSVQGWASWAWDQLKGDLLAAFVGIFLLWLLYAAIGRSPRRWWLYAWLASLPLIVFFVFIAPVMIEPMFFHFTPLADSHPELAMELERVAAHTGRPIPESRMYLMAASAKLNELNAYVDGVGASERVVVWDTTIAHMTTPEIAFVFGHELGHYMLGHIYQGMAFGAALLFIGLWLIAILYRWMVGKYAAAFGLRGIDDFASVPALLLFAAILNFASTPASNAFSRHIEHQADQFGLEAVHGIIPDVPEVAAQSFQILGEEDLEELAPSDLAQFWFYTHPSIADRIRFAYDYDPWGQGELPQFVK